MAELPITPTLTAIIMVGIASFAVLFTAFLLFVRFIQRRKAPALTLVMTFFFFGLGGVSVLVCFILHYVNSPVLAGEIQWARYGINLGYLFSAISNIFVVFFVSQIYSQSPMFRRTKKAIPISNAILNGITVGLIINAISISVNIDSLTDVTEYYNPLYPIGQTIFHLVMTLLAFILLQFFSIKYRREATTRWERVGFNFINYYSMSGMLIYVMFALDLVLGDLWPTVFGAGYTIINYFGWGFAVLMAIFGYLGYAMPKGIRNLLKEKEEK